METPEQIAAREAEEAAAAKAAEAPLSESLASQIVETQERIAKAMETTAQAPAAPLVTSTPESEFAAATTAYNERLAAARTKYSELQTEGKYPEALEVMENVYRTVPQRPAVDPTTTPVFKSLQESAVARARSNPNDAEVFEKWGPEITAELDTMPADQRISDAGIAEAVSRVKALHINDILEAAREKIKAEYAANPNFAHNAPQVPDGGSPDQFHGLDADQRGVAKSMGVPNEVYAEYLNMAPLRDGMSPILPDLKDDETIKPGRF